MKCCDLHAGKLRTRIAIRRPVRTPDGAGGVSRSWSTIASPRAYVKPISGGERFQAMAISATVTHRIFIRYRTDILPSDRIEIGSRLFQIRAVLDIEERKRWLEIFAEEGAQT